MQGADMPWRDTLTDLRMPVGYRLKSVGFLADGDTAKRARRRVVRYDAWDGHVDDHLADSFEAGLGLLAKQGKLKAALQAVPAWDGPGTRRFHRVLAKLGFILK